MEIVLPPSMSKIEYDTPNCVACHLNKNSKLMLYGQGKKGILILLEKQDSIQQTSKTYAVGDRFQWIKDVLDTYGVDIALDCWVTSVVPCYGKEVTINHAKCCQPYLKATIKRLKPQLIIVFGELGAKVLFNSVVDREASCDAVHGLLHNSREFNCYIMSTYLPHTNTKGKRPDSVDDLLIKRDIYVALQSLKEKRPIWKDERECSIILSETDACIYLNACLNFPKKRCAAFDYETNCLRPYNKASKLVSVSICEEEDKSHAFMLTDKTIPLFKQWLLTKNIVKISHNSHFERLWSIVKLGINPVNLNIDTMLLSHALDNRDMGGLSIKFLAPIFIGTTIWNSQVEAFLKPEKKDANTYAINQIDKIPQRTLLLYNAIDSLVEYRTAIVLMNQLKTFYQSFPES